MELRPYRPAEASAVVGLFREVFSASEGADAGTMVARLARDLLATTVPGDLLVWVAQADGRLAAAVCFRRLTLVPRPGPAFILSPMAVRTDCQRQGLGQRLIRCGLGELQRQGVRLVLTYGDPRFYSKVGFAAVSPERLRPPLALSQPEGWLGQTLDAADLATAAGDIGCVPALCDPAYW